MIRQTQVIKVLKLIYEKLFRSLCWTIIGKFRKSVTISTKQGVFTVLLKDSMLSKDLYCSGQFDLNFILETMKFLRSIQRCPPKGEGTIVDIGANIGVISIGALHMGELKKAIAIEPEPQNFSLLRRNVNQNGLTDRFTCLPYAVSHQKGELSFELSGTNFGDHRVRISIVLPNSVTEQYHESGRPIITVKTDTILQYEF